MTSLQEKIDEIIRVADARGILDIQLQDAANKAIQELREEIVELCARWDFSGVVERELLALIGEKK